MKNKKIWLVLATFLILLFNQSLAMAGNFYLKIVFIGNFSSGKTTLVSRYMGEDFSYCRAHTIDFVAQSKFIEYNGHVICLKIWDTAGEEKYHSVVTNFYRGAQIVFYVVDLTEPLGSVQALRYTCERWIEESRVGNPSLRGVIIATKKDGLTEYELNKKKAIIAQAAGYARCPFAVVSGTDPVWLIQYEINRCIREILNEIGVQALSTQDNDAGFLYVERIPDPKSGCC